MKKSKHQLTEEEHNALIEHLKHIKKLIKDNNYCFKKGEK